MPFGMPGSKRSRISPRPAFHIDIIIKSSPRRLRQDAFKLLAIFQIDLGKLVTDT